MTHTCSECKYDSIPKASLHCNMCGFKLDRCGSNLAILPPILRRGASAPASSSHQYARATDAARLHAAYNALSETWEAFNIAKELPDDVSPAVLQNLLKNLQEETERISAIFNQGKEMWLAKATDSRMAVEKDDKTLRAIDEAVRAREKLV